jgi:hypothetical protein
MLRQVRLGTVARIAAALVAVVLSGAPRVLALHAPAETHRCTCPAHGAHACECVLCHQAALAAQAGDGALPPCHRAEATRALAASRDVRPRSAPCIEGTCGSRTRPAVTAAEIEPFCLSSSQALAPSSPERRLPTSLESSPDRTVEPETPPPRSA